MLAERTAGPRARREPLPGWLLSGALDPVTWGNLQGCVLWLALCPGTFEMQKTLAHRGLIDEWQALVLVWAW